MEARQVAATAPLSWIQNAASLFFSNFVGFALIAIAYLAILFLLGLIPILGQIASLLLTAILIAGLYTAIREAKSGQAVKVGQLFRFLSHERTGALVRLSLAPLAFALLLILVVFLLTFAGVGVANVVATGAEATAGGSIFLVLLIAICSALFGLAYSFAVPLVAFENQDVLAALQTSFTGATANIVPMFVFSLLSIILLFLGVLFFGIGLIITSPICFIAFYLAYEDIWG